MMYYILYPAKEEVSFVYTFYGFNYARYCKVLIMVINYYYFIVSHTAVLEFDSWQVLICVAADFSGNLDLDSQQTLGDSTSGQRVYFISEDKRK